MLAWPPLTRAVLHGWRRPARGADFLLVVAAQAVAATAATLSALAGARWLAVLALAPFVAGLGLYAVVVAAFDRRELARGLGDQWVAGGAMAITALAAAAVARAGVLVAVMDEVAVVLWVLAMLWLPPLVLAELRHPRLDFHARRWATVFPVGMYAVMSFAVGRADRLGWMLAFGRVWTCVAVAVWTVVFAATAARGVHLLRRARPVREVGDTAV